MVVRNLLLIKSGPSFTTTNRPQLAPLFRHCCHDSATSCSHILAGVKRDLTGRCALHFPLVSPPIYESRLLESSPHHHVGPRSPPAIPRAAYRRRLWPRPFSSVSPILHSSLPSDQPTEVAVCPNSHEAQIYSKSGDGWELQSTLAEVGSAIVDIT